MPPRYDVMAPGVEQRLDQLMLAYMRGQRRGDSRFDQVDPGAGMFFRRQLEFILPEVLRAKVPNRNGLMLIPRGTDVPKGASSYTQRIWEHIGVAELIANYGDDFQRATVGSLEFTRQVKDYGVAYEWSIRDIWAAMFAGVPLQVEKGTAARRATEERLNRIAWRGDDRVNLLGLLNHPNVPRRLMPNAIAFGTAADTIIADLMDLVNGIDTLTEGVEMATELWLPNQEYSYIASTPRGQTDTTIMQFILQNSPSLEQIRKVHELSATSNYNPTGVGLVVAITPRVDLVRHQIPDPFFQLPVEEKNAAFVVNTIATSGGMDIPFPLSIAIGELP